MQRSLLRQIRLLSGISLRNALGVNEARFSRDPKKRRRLWAMLGLYAALALLLAVYAGGLSAGLILLGAADAVVPLLAAAVSAVVLVVSVFRAGPALFDLRRYEQEAALPVRPAAIVVSRFASMLASGAGLALLFLLPGAAVYGAMLRPAWPFYPLMLLGALLLPLLPTAAAMLLGALVYGVAARMRRKNAAAAVLSLLLVLTMLVAPVLLTGSAEPDLSALAALLAALGSQVGKAYPPAAWFADGVVSLHPGSYGLFAGGSLFAFLLVALLIGRWYQSICTRLGSHAAARRFVLAPQRRRTVLAALYRRELSRYLASSVYVTNTLVGYLLCVLLSAAVLFAGLPAITAQLPLPPERVRALLPFVLAAPCALSPTTACAVSIEGRQWWLIRSLPVSDAAVLSAKLLVGLTVALPCYALAELLLCIALRPAAAELPALLLLPLAYILFSTALGLFLNLRMPVLDWESETAAVKQGRALLFTMLLGMLSVLLPAALRAALPALGGLFTAALLFLLFAGALLLARRALSTPLSRVEERL